MFRINIRKNDSGEFEVPTDRADSVLGAQTSIYYTDDRSDAITTARFVHGLYGYQISVMVKRGTYAIEATK